jgi:hypothetical protein
MILLMGMAGLNFLETSSVRCTFKPGNDGSGFGLCFESLFVENLGCCRGLFLRITRLPTRLIFGNLNLEDLCMNKLLPYLF